MKGDIKKPVKVARRYATDVSDELKALEVCVRALNELDPKARVRAMKYLDSRFMSASESYDF